MALLLDLACSDTERKQILAPYGLTVEGFDELFGHHLGSTGTGDG